MPQDGYKVFDPQRACPECGASDAEFRAADALGDLIEAVAQIHDDFGDLKLDHETACKRLADALGRAREAIR